MLRLLCFACVLHALVTHVSGVAMSISPDVVVLNDGVSRELTMVCSSGGQQLTEDELFNYGMIKRNRSRETADPVVLARITAIKGPELFDVADMIGRKPNISGELQQPAGATRFNMELKLTWDTRQIVCDDAGQYICEMAYLDADSQPKTSTAPSSLTVKSYPSDLTIRLMENGVPVSAPAGTMGQPKEYRKDEQVHLECSASIGSDRSIKIVWWRTSDFTQPPDMNDLMKVSEADGSIDEGTPSDEMTDCKYSRTSTLTYNFTEIDENSKIAKLFLCRIEYRNSINQLVTLESDKKIYIRGVKSSSGGDRPGEVASAGGGSNAGIIAGSVIGALVLVVLVVLLVYFMWYRRRGDGETYRTKEENGPDNPNMVTESTPYSTTDYAVPHKERNAFHNEGLDEPHEERSRRRNDYRERNDRHRHRDRDDRYKERDNRGGRSNYGMDRENDSDGSPTMTPHVNHMGYDPQESIGTGV